MKAPVLAVYNLTLFTEIKVDALNFATKGVLSQKQKQDGLWHSVTYRSEAISVPEQNYEIYNKELLAII